MLTNLRPSPNLSVQIQILIWTIFGLGQDLDGAYIGIRKTYTSTKDLDEYRPNRDLDDNCPNRFGRPHLIKIDRHKLHNWWIVIFST